MIAPDDRPAFVIALVVALVVLALAVVGIVLLGRKRGAEARSGLVIAGLAGLAILGLGGALTSLVIGLVLLSNNR